MTVTSKKPNSFFLAVGGLLSGAGFACWLMLFYFEGKWNKTGPDVPAGEYTYAHVEHGGLTYFNALQSTASHLWWPVWAISFVGIVMVGAAYGENPFSRGKSEQPYPLTFGYQLAGAVVALAVTYFYGHDILNALIHTPLGPGNDDLSLVSKD